VGISLANVNVVELVTVHLLLQLSVTETTSVVIIVIHNFVFRVGRSGAKKVGGRVKIYQSRLLENLSHLGPEL